MVDEMKYIKILMMILQSSHKVSRPVDVGMFENEICDPNGTLMGKINTNHEIWSPNFKHPVVC